MPQFVAGARFYNHEMFGGIRPGEDVRLLSKSYFGLAVSAFASSFVYIGLRNGLLLMVCDELAFTPLETQAVDRLAELPAAFSFFVGLITDAVPVFGFRRKSYIIIGAVLSLGSLLLTSIAYCFDSSLRHVLGRGYVYLVTFLIGSISVGSMISFASVQTMVIALSQREILKERGVIQANYLIARGSGQVVARILVFLVNRAGTAYQVSLMLLALTTISVMTIISTIVCLDEDRDFSRQTIRSKCDKHWLLAQQKAMWRTLSFISSFAFCLGFKFSEAQKALQEWSHAENNTSLLVSSILVDFVMIGTIIVWRSYYMNALWRRVFSAAPAASIVSTVMVSTFTIPAILRDQVVYTLLTGVTGVSAASIALSTLVPVTEIAQEGSEGGVAGLAISFYTISKVFANTFLSALQNSNVIDLGDPIQDSRHVRWAVATAQIVTVLVNALSFAGIVLLPMQKLDAQQLRTFGGFARSAGSATVIVFVLLLVYCIAYNCLVLIPSTACVVIAGRSGCHPEP
ncbi:Transmembrane protein, partial [Globisporangium splendens]